MSNTVILHTTEDFARGEFDNVSAQHSRVTLDMVQGTRVPYGCYTSPALPLPAFDALRMSWNAATPEGTAVEPQVRLLVDGNWTAWISFGRWGTRMQRTGASPAQRGPLVIRPDHLVLDSKVAAQAQLRIYLYTKDEHTTPAVTLLGVSVRAVDVIPAGGRPLHRQLHLLPYVMTRRAPALREVMDLAIGIVSLTNRWGADLLPEEVAQAMRDYRRPDDRDRRNLSFAAAAAGAWGSPARACRTDLAGLRQELRQGCGAVVALESTPAQQASGWPALRYAALRGFGTAEDGSSTALLCDPWAGETDFEAETVMPLDEFLVAWNNQALFMRRRPGLPPEERPCRQNIWLRKKDRQHPDLYCPHVGGEAAPLPEDFCEKGGVLAWSEPDEHPHATTGHRLLHFVQPEQGCIRLPTSEEHDRKCTVYAIDPTGAMQVGDVTV